MASAAYAQWLALKAGLDNQQAWLGGMMVRLGELLIGVHQPAQLSEIELQPLAPGERWRRELQLLGFTEAQVTAELTRRWLFPADLIKGLDATSDPMQQNPFNRLGGVLHLAGLLAEMSPEALLTLDDLPADLLSALSLDRAELQSTLRSSDSFLDLSTL
jgi:HD-like signal output (HDOD) protein